VLSYVFPSTDTKLEYAVFVPRKVDKKKPAPLVVALHGAGAHPGTIVSQVRDAADKAGMIVVGPTGYHSQAFFGAAGANMRTIDIPNVGTLAEQDVMNVLDIVRKDYLIDERRIYVIGHSMGGGGALHLARKYPAIWAGVAVAAPALPFSPALLDDIARIPVMIVAGDQDTVARMETIEPFGRRLKELGPPHVFAVVKGGTHFSAMTAGAEPMITFLASRTKPDAAK
jgi:poly(3-hydroxybutyrate) depolymerase